jgi:sn-glycerol 3-phosphate transport system permease protein
MARSTRATVGAHIVLAVISLVTIAPIVWMVGISFQPPRDVLADPLNPIPFSPTLQNYQAVFAASDVGRQLLNTIIFAGGVTLGQILIAIPAAYAFSQWRFRGANALFVFCLATLTIPGLVFFLPHYVMVTKTNGLNTYWGLIIPQVASAYGIFLLRQHYRAFPKSIISAARMDGASEWVVMTRILLPAMCPALMSLGIYVFVGAWNEYIWPNLIAPKKPILTVGLTQFSSVDGGNQWGPIMAAATLTSLPTLAAFLLLRRYVLGAVAEGGVRG